MLAALSLSLVSASSVQAAALPRQDAASAAPAPSVTDILTPRPADAPNGDYGAYLTFAEMQAKIAGWLRDYPNLVQVSSLGKTFEGRPIPLIRLSAAPDDGKTPEVMLLSGIHPREQQPQIGVAALMDELCSAYGKDPTLTQLLQKRVVWIVPVFNVDGKVYDMEHGNGATRGADWRKNRQPNGDGTFGTDLNRNFGVRWGGNHEIDATWQTTTDTTTADIFEGGGPISSPEDQDLVRFVKSRGTRLRAFIDLHSPFGELLAPNYLIGPEYDRYAALLGGMNERQAEPYPGLTKIHKDGEPKPGVRPGDTGISYTYLYYTLGIYALNLEYAPPKEARRGVVARYPPPAEIDEEYRKNVRGPLLYFLNFGGTLPPPHPGAATVAGGSGTLAAPLTPGAKGVVWTPPPISGPWAYAVLVSEGKEVGVSSEYRIAPLSGGFTLEVNKNAVPGAQVPLTLYLWDRDRGESTAHFTLTIAGK